MILPNTGGYTVIFGLPFYVAFVHVDGVQETKTSSNKE